MSANRKPQYVLCSDIATKQVRLVVADAKLRHPAKFNTPREAAKVRSRRRLYNFGIRTTS